MLLVFQTRRVIFTLVACVFGLDAAGFGRATSKIHQHSVDGQIFELDHVAFMRRHEKHDLSMKPKSASALSKDRVSDDVDDDDNAAGADNFDGAGSASYGGVDNSGQSDNSDALDGGADDGQTSGGGAVGGQSDSTEASSGGADGDQSDSGTGGDGENDAEDDAADDQGDGTIPPANPSSCVAGGDAMSMGRCEERGSAKTFDEKCWDCWSTYRNNYCEAQLLAGTWDEKCASDSKTRSDFCKGFGEYIIKNFNSGEAKNSEPRELCFYQGSAYKNDWCQERQYQGHHDFSTRCATDEAKAEDYCLTWAHRDAGEKAFPSCHVKKKFMTEYCRQKTLSPPVWDAVCTNEATGKDYCDEFGVNVSEFKSECAGYPSYMESFCVQKGNNAQKVDACASGRKSQESIHIRYCQLLGGKGVDFADCWLQEGYAEAYCKGREESDTCKNYQSTIPNKGVLDDMINNTNDANATQVLNYLIEQDARLKHHGVGPSEGRKVLVRGR